ncbi:MAG: hypothetical protein WAT66_10925 [Actinomycetota bacterium]
MIDYPLGDMRRDESPFFILNRSVTSGTGCDINYPPDAFYRIERAKFAEV